MSGYMISPIGFLIIAAYSAVIGGVFFFVNRLMKGFRWRWMLVGPPALVLLSLPWAEEAWISWHFNEACKDAGVKVYRQVVAEGYAGSIITSKRGSISIGPLFSQDPTQQAPFEKDGYRFYEDLLIGGGARHLERAGDRVVVTLRDQPEARYILKYSYQPQPSVIEEPIGWKLKKIERQVIDSHASEILGKETKIIRIFPTHEALVAKYLGPPILICPRSQGNEDFNAAPKLANAPPYTPLPPFPQAIIKPIATP